MVNIGSLPPAVFASGLLENRDAIWYDERQKDRFAWVGGFSVKIIVGLGNPGGQYSGTRHNAGFMAVDALAAHLGAAFWRNKFEAEVAEARIGGEQTLLVKPQTYMNLSGNAVGQILRWYKAGIGDVIALYDDMDLPVGAARLRQRGSSGGHRGVESLLASLGGEGFARVKIGIGRPLPGWTVVDHVLAKFTKEERESIDGVIDKLIPAVECIVKQGIDVAMNRYSFKAKKTERKAAGGEEQKV